MGQLVACLLIFWGFGTTGISAQVVINEFSAKSPEWVELYNPTHEDVNLMGWLIKDAAKHTLELAVILPAGCFTTVETNWLNDTGDTIYLVESATSSAFVDSIIYGTGELITVPPSGKSAGRVPDGSPNWYADLETSRGTSNPNTIPSPTSPPPPTPTKTPTPTRTPTTKPTPHNPQPTTILKSPTPKPTTFNVQQTTILKLTTLEPTTYDQQPTTTPDPTTYNLQPTTSGLVLSDSVSNIPTDISLPWGALVLIVLGVILICTALFLLIKKPNSN